MFDDRGRRFSSPVTTQSQNGEKFEPLGLNIGQARYFTHILLSDSIEVVNLALNFKNKMIIHLVKDEN